MPELPEVETIKLQLEKFLKGKKIVSVEVKSRKIFQGDEKKLIGGKVINVRRFGKVLCIDLANKYSILAHVKLTGQFIYRGPELKNEVLSEKVIGGIPGIHTHVIFRFDKGILYYNDVRRFGWVRVVKTSEVEEEPFIKKLGPEPFRGLTLKNFSEILSKSGRAIKLVLMDQTKISGIGNIYANDAFNLARIDPRTPSKNLRTEEIKNLYEAILKVLRLGIKYGGASDQYYLDARGKKGHYQEHFLVYNRTGEKCFNCGNLIKKFFLGGRGTYWCPNCQK